MGKGEIWSCYHVGWMKILLQRAHKLLRTLAAQLFCKRNINQDIHPHAFQNIGLGNIITNLHRLFLWCQHRKWMIAEGQHHAEQLMLLSVGNLRGAESDVYQISVKRAGKRPFENRQIFFGFFGRKQQQ